MSRKRLERESLNNEEVKRISRKKTSMFPTQYV